VEIETFPVGPLGCNCSLLIDPASKEAIVVDPGGDFAKIQARLAAHGARVTRIVHTHTHIDHVGATAPLQEATRAPASIHEGDRFLYNLLPVQSAMLGIAEPPRADMDSDLVDGAVFRMGSQELAVMHTPGHTPGSCCFLATFNSQSIVFSGDTLFRSGVGRTDLWGGDEGALRRSITGKLFQLDGEAIVVPGHGPRTTIGTERGDHRPGSRIEK
jgi:glyoxylase-like metal-dependent hydrolase (beta-lactamase superfamily II)